MIFLGADIALFFKTPPENHFQDIGNDRLVFNQIAFDCTNTPEKIRGLFTLPHASAFEHKSCNMCQKLNDSGLDFSQIAVNRKKCDNF